MKVIITKKTMTAKEFVIQWLNKHQSRDIEHDDNWAHFVSIVTEASEAYHEFMEKRKQASK